VDHQLFNELVSLEDSVLVGVLRDVVRSLGVVAVEVLEDILLQFFLCKLKLV
jgi:hypothetical protein